MSADTLRRAAAKLRERAERATVGPWSASVVDSPRSHMNSALYSMAHPTGTPESEVVGAVRKDRSAGIRNPHDARYFELMHPPVALALADWLERDADELARHQTIWEENPNIPDTSAHVEAMFAHQLAVARAILREATS